MEREVEEKGRRERGEEEVGSREGSRKRGRNRGRGGLSGRGGSRGRGGSKGKGGSPYEEHSTLFWKGFPCSSAEHSLLSSSLPAVWHISSSPCEEEAERKEKDRRQE